MALNEIKKHIETTQKTAKITNAMQMVSRNKLNRLKSLTQTYQLYTDQLRHALQSLHYTLKVTPPSFDHADTQAMITPRPVKSVGIFLVTTDKGLAGSYNLNTLQGLDQWILEQGYTRDQVKLFTLGHVGEKYAHERKYQVLRAFYPLSDQPSYEEAHHLIRKVRRSYNSKDIDELYVAFQHFSGSGTCKFGVDKLLPILNLNRPLQTEGLHQTPQLLTQTFQIEPSIESVLETLLPQYIESLVYGAFLQAKTSEHFNRMTAMKSATDNASEMIKDLQLKFNQERQLKVTNEIIEIVAGAQAQAQSKERRK